MGSANNKWLWKKGMIGYTVLKNLFYFQVVYVPYYNNSGSGCVLPSTVFLLSKLSSPDEYGTH